MCKAALLKGDWTSEFMAGSWPNDFSTLLAQIGDPRFLDDLTSILASEKGNAFSLCTALRRVGIAAIDPLLSIYRTTHAAQAATALCEIPGSADTLMSRLTAEQLEELIAQRYEYTGGSSWDENFMRLLGELKTPRCIAWLKQASVLQFADPAVTAQRKALVESI
ncbi:MAG TPA: hypothetical protein VGM23_18535, partial [Armatimonadota bacterium]